MDNQEPEAPDIDDSKEWQEAKSLTALFGHVSNLFTGTVRGLQALRATEPLGPKRELDKQSLFNILRILGGPSAKVKIYYAAKTFYPELLTQRERDGLTPRTLVEIFDLDELSALITLMVLHSKASALFPAAEWSTFGPRINAFTEAGMALGRSISSIGGGNGMLVGGMRYYAFAAFAHHSPTGFKEYTRTLRKKRVAADHTFERETWGCTSAHVIALLMKLIGYRSPFAGSFYIAFSTDTSTGDDHDARLLRTAMVWLDSLMIRGQAPESDAGDDLNIEEKDAELLLHKIDKLKSEGSAHGWLARTPSSLKALKIPTFHTVREEEASVSPDELDAEQRNVGTGAVTP